MRRREALLYIAGPRTNKENTARSACIEVERQGRLAGVTADVNLIPYIGCQRYRPVHLGAEKHVAKVHRCWTGSESGNTVAMNRDVYARATAPACRALKRTDRGAE